MIRHQPEPQIRHRSRQESNKAMEELGTASHKLAEEVYKAAQAKQQGPKGQPGAGDAGAAGPGPSDAGPAGEEPKKKDGEDVIDAEFKEK